ncbi:MAG TPA: transcription elongation factor GreA [Fimbriimonadaceae bacterium]|nr:transcription elongation factor GreA [Fimbriimonadaceae bacterium]
MEELEPTITAQVLLLTPEGYQRLHEELEHLTVIKRAEIAERLRDSKQHGEFSEDNSELDEVKFEQAMVENRIADLKGIFATAQQLDPATISTERVGIGTFVTVRDDDRRISFEVRIVTSVEANPDEDLVSNESPMGTALFGKKVGEIAEFNAPVGRIKYKVEKIRA